MTDEFTLRREFRQAIKQLANDHMRSPAQRARLTTYLEECMHAEKKRPRGRPSKGIRAKFRQIVVYLPPAMIEALDAVADRQEQASGHHMNRADIIRAALSAYLKQQQRRTPRKDAP
jgi:predicted kinase